MPQRKEPKESWGLAELEFSLYLKKAGLASRNIVHIQKSFYVVSVSAFIFFILYVKPIRSLLIQRTPAGSSFRLLAKTFYVRLTLTHSIPRIASTKSLLSSCDLYNVHEKSLTERECELNYQKTVSIEGKEGIEKVLNFSTHNNHFSQKTCKFCLSLWTFHNSITKNYM